MKYVILLTISILGEVLGTTMLKTSTGFTSLLPSIGVVAGYGISFYCLSLTLKHIALSLAYAIWSGAGTVLTVIIGIIIWNEALSLLKFLGIALVIGGIILLNVPEDEKEKRSQRKKGAGSV